MAFGFISLLLLCAGAIVIVLLLVVLFARRKPQPAPVAPAENINPAERQQQREAILEQLSQKQISQDEAERQLLELDNPVPAEMPPPPPQSRGKGCGCLIASVIALALIGLLVLLLLGFVGIRTRTYHHQEAIMHEEHQPMHHQP